MFNGYVWQTRTLEVRPDRLPSDYDAPIGVVKPAPLNNSSMYGGLHALSPLHSMSVLSSSLPPPPMSLSNSNYSGILPSSFSTGESDLLSYTMDSGPQMNSYNSNLGGSSYDSPTKVDVYRDLLKNGPGSIASTEARTIYIQSVRDSHRWDLTSYSYFYLSFRLILAAMTSSSTFPAQAP